MPDLTMTEADRELELLTDAFHMLEGAVVAFHAGNGSTVSNLTLAAAAKVEQTGWIHLTAELHQAKTAIEAGNICPRGDNYSRIGIAWLGPVERTRGALLVLTQKLNPGPDA